MDESSYSIFTQKEYAPDKIHQKALSFIENNKKIKVIINSSQSKVATTKSSTGKATAYRIKVETNIEITQK